MSQIIGHISQVIGPVVDIYLRGLIVSSCCQVFMMHWKSEDPTVKG